MTLRGSILPWLWTKATLSFLQCVARCDSWPPQSKKSRYFQQDESLSLCHMLCVITKPLGPTPTQGQGITQAMTN